MVFQLQGLIFSQKNPSHITFEIIFFKSPDVVYVCMERNIFFMVFLVENKWIFGFKIST